MKGGIGHKVCKDKHQYEVSLLMIRCKAMEKLDGLMVRYVRGIWLMANLMVRES